MGVRRREFSHVFVISCALVVLAACGARVTDEQRLAAVGNGTRTGSASGSGSAAGSTGGGLAPGAGDNGGGAATTVAGASGGGPTTTAFSGNNGGATDVGITADTITLGNVATLSGPVP